MLELDFKYPAICITYAPLFSLGAASTSHIPVVGPAEWMDASPEVLAPTLHDRLTRYMITLHGDRLIMGQLIL